VTRTLEIAEDRRSSEDLKFLRDSTEASALRKASAGEDTNV